MNSSSLLMESVILPTDKHDDETEQLYTLFLKRMDVPQNAIEFCRIERERNAKKLYLTLTEPDQDPDLSSLRLAELGVLSYQNSSTEHLTTNLDHSQRIALFNTALLALNLPYCDELIFAPQTNAEQLNAFLEAALLNNFDNSFNSVITRLTRQGAHVSQRKLDLLLIHHASLNNTIAVISLLHAGACVNKFDQSNHSALSYSIWHNNTTSTLAILSRRPNASIIKGRICFSHSDGQLMHATAGEIKWQLSEDQYINNNKGRAVSLLYIAAEFKNAVIIDGLLSDLLMDLTAAAKSYLETKFDIISGLSDIDIIKRRGLTLSKQAEKYNVKERLSRYIKTFVKNPQPNGSIKECKMALKEKTTTLQAFNREYYTQYTPVAYDQFKMAIYTLEEKEPCLYTESEASVIAKTISWALNYDHATSNARWTTSRELLNILMQNMTNTPELGSIIREEPQLLPKLYGLFLATAKENPSAAFGYVTFITQDFTILSTLLRHTIESGITDNHALAIAFILFLLEHELLLTLVTSDLFDKALPIHLAFQSKDFELCKQILVVAPYTQIRSLKDQTASSKSGADLLKSIATFEKQSTYKADFVDLGIYIHTCMQRSSHFTYDERMESFNTISNLVLDIHQHGLRKETQHALKTEIDKAIKEFSSPTIAGHKIQPETMATILMGIQQFIQAGNDDAKKTKLLIFAKQYKQFYDSYIQIKNPVYIAQTLKK